MKKFIKKYSISIVFILIFLLFLLYGINQTIYQIRQTSQPEKVYPIFLVEAENSRQTISPYDDGNGNLYVFLPSYANMTKVTVNYESPAKLFIGDTLVANGTNCSSFELETPYNYEFEQNKSTIYFYKSANVATLDISTSSGTIDNIHYDKFYEEYASFVLYTQNGQVNCSDTYSRLKGRGNSTWQHDKKPYKLTLSTDQEILGMPASSSWILLANILDESNINNKLVYDFAKKLDFGWSPDSRYVDVYINDEYRGLYLLCEKPEIAENRLNIQNNGGFFCKIEPQFKEPELNNPFTTERGRTVEINFPERLSSSDLNNAHLLINELEKAIFSGNDLSQNPIFDLDSWVYKYLIDEIFANTDADVASNYFYYSNGSFKGGPIWDYDGTLGGCNPMHKFPNSLIATNPIKAKEFSSRYYGALYQNTSFYSRLTELYSKKALPLLEELTSHEIYELIEEISLASHMNSLRWFSASNKDPSNDESVEQKRITYLKERVSFLNDLWINNTPYCTIRFWPFKSSSCTYLAVKQGDILDITKYYPEQQEWLIKETGEKMDFSKPITSDITLTDAIDNTKPDDSIPTIILLSVSLLFVFFVIALAINLIRSRKQRRSSDANK